MAECIYNAYALVGAKSDQSYDFKGQLLGVKEDEEYVECYAYDRAGNMTKKVVRGSRFVVRDGVGVPGSDPCDTVAVIRFAEIMI